MGPVLGRIGLLLPFALLGGLLAACNTTEPLDNREPDVFDKVRSIDLLPRYPTQVRQAEVSTGRRSQPIIYPAETSEGTKAAAASPPADARSAGGDVYELNFENTPVASVAKVVLGDILGVGYVIDARVQGNISLSSGRPVPKADILFALENALRVVGIALVRDNLAYRLMPQGDAAGSGPADYAERTQPGYGLSVVPLQHVSAQTLMKLVDSFGTKPGMVRADPVRNLILVQGTGSERRNAVDLVTSFDADWMRGQAVGIFPVQNSNPEPIIAEIEKIIDSGEGGIAQDAVKFQTISRMNAILAVTRKTSLLRQVETWIQRLDTADTGRTGIHVYRIKYGDARQIARVLNDLFGGGGGAGGTSAADSAASQIAPGSGFASSSSSSKSGSALSRLSVTQPGSAGAASGARTGGTASSAPGAAAPQAASLLDRGGGLFDRAGAGTSGTRAGAAGLMEGVRITPDTVNNSLLIYASQEQYSIIERTIRQIDHPQLQVAIDATIAEVTLTDQLQYGVQAYLTSKNLGLKPNIGSVSNSAASSLISAAGDVVLSRAIPGFNFLAGSSTTPTAILSALHAVTDVKVLSNPSLVVIDNQVATLQVGDEIPIQTGSATVLTGSNTIANTTDYRSTGIMLRVMPRINANGNVRLDIEQEISNPVGGSSTSSSSSSTSTNSLTPTVSTRKVQSSVAVASGQTVLLAGLISDTQNRNRNGIPGLDQIPGVGDVFAQTDISVKRTELIIFIRPQIIRDGADAHFVAEELRTKLRGTIGAVGTRQTAPPRYR